MYPYPPFFPEVPPSGKWALFQIGVVVAAVLITFLIAYAAGADLKWLGINPR